MDGNVTHLVAVVAIIQAIKGNLALALSVALGGLLIAQTARLHSTESRLLALQASVAKASEARAVAALKVTEGYLLAETRYTKDTQENVDEYVASSEVAAAIARGERSALERLLLDSERRAATYRAQATASAAACRDLADQHAALDRHVAEGAIVVAEHQDDLGRRDREVALLYQQVINERKRCEEQSTP